MSPYVSPDVSDAERVAANTQQTATCWLWTGHRQAHGYGRITVRGRRMLAHRFVYETVIGPIPEGLSLDHLCRNPSCVNPEHLEPVTHAENVRRGEAPSQTVRRTNRCKRGHELTPENVYVYDRSRHCKQCIAIRAGRAA